MSASKRFSAFPTGTKMVRRCIGLAFLFFVCALLSPPLTQSATSQGYVLWTRSDSGKAVLWQVDPSSGAFLGSVSVGDSSGLGASWAATSFQYVGGSAYVLWSRTDTGQAALWQIDPKTGLAINTVNVPSATGIGANWQATSYVHVSATEGYVLWTRSDTGQAVLWQINPGTGAQISSASLYSTSGIGGPWKATSYDHVSESEGYVLWTRSDTGQGVVWQIEFNSAAGSPKVIPVRGRTSLYSKTGVGGPWEATSYRHVSGTEGYVLWTRSDNGQGVLWQVDPSNMPNTLSIDRLVSLTASGGNGASWVATSYEIGGPTGGVVLNGASDPTTETGSDGDFYINTMNNTLFGPKTAGAWGSGTSLVGPQGPQGPTGPSGVLGFYTVEFGGEHPPCLGNPPCTGSITVGCSPGDKVIGGGFEDGWRGSDTTVVRSSRPATYMSGWTVVFEDFGTTTSYVKNVFAVCADMTP